MKYYKDNQYGNNNNWQYLNDLFNSLATRLFTSNYKTFPTKGTLASFESLVGFLNRDNNIYWIIGTLGEYQPMIALLPPERVIKANLISPFCSINEIAEQIGCGIQCYITKPHSRIIVFLSSSLRIGGIYLDIESLSNILLKKDLREKCELWIDASQDNRIFTTPDIIWYSKWHVGTGGGIVLAKHSRYKDDLLLKILEIRSGYNPRYIAKACAHFQFYRSGFPVSFIELTKSTLLLEKDTIKYISYILTTLNEKIDKYLKQHLKLYCNFDIKNNDCAIPGIVCRINIISTFKTSATEMRQYLREHNIIVDAFELHNENILCSSNYNSTITSVNNFCYNNPYIIWELLPPCIEQINDYQKYFNEAIGYHHKNFRIYLSCNTSCNDIEAFIEALRIFFS